MPRTQCSGAQRETALGRNSPGNNQASTTTAPPSRASVRRTPVSGTKRLSTAYTASTSHMVTESAGAKPNLAPVSPEPAPTPVMSITMARACESHPASSAPRRAASRVSPRKAANR